MANGNEEKQSSILASVSADEKRRQEEAAKGVVPVLPARGPLSDAELSEKTRQTHAGRHKHTAEPIRYVDNE